MIEPEHSAATIGIMDVSMPGARQVLRAPEAYHYGNSLQYSEVFLHAVARHGELHEGLTSRVVYIMRTII